MTELATVVRRPFTPCPFARSCHRTPLKYLALAVARRHAPRDGIDRSVTGVRPSPRILPIVERAIPAIVERRVTAIATKAAELASVAPDAAHMGSTEVAVHVSSTESGNAASHETADTISAKGANMASTKTPNVRSAEAANMPSAKAANMPSTKAATVATAPTAATTGLRVGCKQAASQRRGHQDSHYPSQHEFFLSVCDSVSAMGLQNRSGPFRPRPIEVLAKI
jgi:hypothetical protein